MAVLGVDFGLRKIGIAIAERTLAEPLEVVRFETENEALEKIARISKTSGISKIVVGVSEGEMGEQSKNFSLRLRNKLDIPVEEFDETLTTYDANRYSIEAGQNRKKRKKLEDAFAAAIMLQNYLDVNSIKNVA